jgi:hypothetical protein
MQPDWDYVKKTTLWQYEELIKKLIALQSWPVIWKAYNHELASAPDFARRLFPHNKIEAGEYPSRVLSTLDRLNSTGIRDWGSLLSRVLTRMDCTAFVSGNGLNFEEFIDLLNYLLRWAFPFQTAARELLEHENPQEMCWYPSLKQNKIMYSFELLEQGRTGVGRKALSQITGLPLGFVTLLVHRADIARLPFARRKTILPLCGSGYDTLAKIAAADQIKMESDLDAYFRHTQGKPWENFRSVIVIKGLITWARVIPVLMES